MYKPPRNLRMLVLDDADNKQIRAIERRHIDIADCEHYYPRADPVKRIARWAQLVRLLREDRIPVFDLFVIDVLFEQDKTVPDAGQGREAADTPGSGLGLLHALAVIANRHAQSTMPFAWTVVSGNALAVKNDPVTVISYGYITAFERRVLGTLEDINSLSYAISNAIEEIGPPTDIDIWIRTLMTNYRARLREACETTMQLDSEDLTRLIARLNNICPRGDDILDDDAVADLTLDIALPPRYTNKDHIFLRSLYADYRDLDNSAVKAIVNDLTELLTIANNKDIFKFVKSVCDELRKGVVSLPQLLKPFPKDLKHQIGVGVMICSWLEYYYSQQPGSEDAQRKTLLCRIDCKQQQADRILKNARYPEQSTGEFVKSLATRTLEEPYFSCAHRYMLDVIKPPPGGRHPVCIMQARS